VRAQTLYYVDLNFPFKVTNVARVDGKEVSKEVIKLDKNGKCDVK